MSRNKTIDYVEFRTTDLVATRQFYSGVLGWASGPMKPSRTSHPMEVTFMSDQELNSSMCIRYFIPLPSMTECGRT